MNGDFVTLALRHGIGDATPARHSSSDESTSIVEAGRRGKTWVTTRGVLAEETRMIEFAVQGKVSCKPVCRNG